LYERLGSVDVEGWEEMSEDECVEAMNDLYPEFERMKAAVACLTMKSRWIGRRAGTRHKLTDADVRRIKKNGHTNITRLAKKLGVTRQTIHNVLGKRPPPPKPEATPNKVGKVTTVWFQEGVHADDKRLESAPNKVTVLEGGRTSVFQDVQDQLGKLLDRVDATHRKAKETLADLEGKRKHKTKPKVKARKSRR
jgi:hypothetical protein